MQKVHFIAIGGAVMHNLAMALHGKGYRVSGSDDEINEPSRSRLAAKGLLPEACGWFPEKISKDLDAVILGMHARVDNPELLKAQALNVPVFSFPEYLFRQTENKLRVVIGGSHGKTTITSMIMHVLKALGKDFDYMVGSTIPGFETMVRLTPGAPFAVFEGDEYLSSPLDRRPKFHLYHPRLALLSGIAWDHINVFPTPEIYEAQFITFVRNMEEGAVLVWCEEDPVLRSIVETHAGHLRTRGYGLPVHKLEDHTTILETAAGDVPLQIFGRHNLLNLEGARLICDELNVSADDFFRAISSFPGAARRLELVAAGKTSAVFRDFAHSPSKLKATTEAVKSQFPGRSLVACMELHTFSSLNKDFLAEYKDSMSHADRAIVYFNPHTIAHKKLAPVSPEEVADAFGGRTEIFTDSEKLRVSLLQSDWKDRNLLMMSSGTFDGIDLQELAGRILS